ncbi:MAG TPA: hypothetical protein VJ728_05180 [Candidatus Binataceae bacterium]|nr:hypothetical protein [Candidatus Binataceae bacterium]
MPLIVTNVVMHVVGLNLIGAFVLGDFAIMLRRRTSSMDFIMVVGVTAVLTILLHTLESATWGAAYFLLGALADTKSAMLYSLGAMTTYGHTTLRLSPQWQLLGAMEALEGMLLFGLTTAFLFSIFSALSPARREQIQRWPSRRAR